jgi:anti-sigma B factor antagonist
VTYQRLFKVDSCSFKQYHRVRVVESAGPVFRAAVCLACPAQTTWFPDRICTLRGRSAQVPDGKYPVEMISGMPVVTAPADIDVTAADQLREVLLHAVSIGHTTVVVDMTRTQFCNSSGLGVLVRAHKRALEEGGELRLVIPVGGAVFRIFTLTSLYRFIPRFGSRQEALLQRPAAPIGSRPDPSAELGSLAHRRGSPDRGVWAGG